MTMNQDLNLIGLCFLLILSVLNHLSCPVLASCIVRVNVESNQEQVEETGNNAYDSVWQKSMSGNNTVAPAANSTASPDTNGTANPDANSTTIPAATASPKQQCSDSFSSCWCSPTRFSQDGTIGCVSQTWGMAVPQHEKVWSVCLWSNEFDISDVLSVKMIPSPSFLRTWTQQANHATGGSDDDDGSSSFSTMTVLFQRGAALVTLTPITRQRFNPDAVRFKVVAVPMARLLQNDVEAVTEANANATSNSSSLTNSTDDWMNTTSMVNGTEDIDNDHTNSSRRREHAERVYNNMVAFFDKIPSIVILLMAICAMPIIISLALVIGYALGLVCVLVDRSFLCMLRIFGFTGNPYDDDDGEEELPKSTRVASKPSVATSSDDTSSTGATVGLDNV